MSKISEDLNAFSVRYWVLREEGKVQFNKAVKDIFTEYEFLSAISWKQYTKYFNDGDTCDFHVYKPYFIISEVKSPDDLPRDLEELDEDDVDTIKFPFPLPGYYYTSEKNYYKNDIEAYEKGLEIVGSQVGEAKKDFEEFGRFIQSNYDLMLSLFDDHATVTIYRTENGIKSEATEYDHD